MKTVFAYSLILGVFVEASGCNPPPPQLANIIPSQGYPGQVVMVDGQNLDAATVLWDAGQPSERPALRSVLITRYFQIPRDATPGTHLVRLRNAGGLSTASVEVTVLTSNFPKPSPRIEDIGINDISDLNGTAARVLLSVSAANIDPDALVEVNDISRPAAFYSAIPSDYFSTHDPATYGYPVLHYGMLIVYLDNQAYNKELKVKVTNADGSFAQRIDSFDARGALDSDNDGLPDDWEINGYHDSDGTVVDLPGIGCNPHRKDVLVEVDWMRNAVPHESIWPGIKQAFEDAPVLNPDGSQGIKLHIDCGPATGTNSLLSISGGTVIDDYESIDFQEHPLLTRFAHFADLKEANFDKHRKGIFHYCIFADAHTTPASGRSEIGGDDFFLSFATRDPADWNNDIAVMGSFIHELGHNFGLRHGGLDNNTEDFHECYKWNQASSMNYRYQMDGVPMDPKNLSLNTPLTQTYSEGMFSTLSEQYINEWKGISDNVSRRMGHDDPRLRQGPMNINSGPMIDGIIHNWNEEETDATDVHIDYDEWGHLELNFRKFAKWDSTPPPNYDPDPGCARFEWSVQVLRLVPINTDVHVRLDGSQSIDAEVGRCAPPATCGISIPCVPEGDYVASVLIGAQRFYLRSDTNSVSIPNDTTNRVVLHFVSGSPVVAPLMFVR